ncbi:MAG TPA: heparan-alpha-glucosaminide N-acetyltransferase domain-containing protein [Steroidobacteraceae bacterium]|nr:heparan-alpha-glucosaminide N-acetyltransferase domain-containing protein [Steroidobacteraceae bacterium]
MNTAADQRGYRLTSIDMLRGLVIIIMALDHVRDFFMQGAQQDPMNNPDVGTALYFTRWITHFCAPVFVFLAGTSAGLMVARKSPAELARFLLTRGLWLVFVEWFVVSTAISFAPLGSAQFGGKTFLVLQVIWAIGMSMIVLAACQFLGRKICLILGALIVLGHNSLDGVWPTQQTFGDPTTPLWIGLHTFFGKVMGPFFVFNVYPLLPWIGVMLLGFGAAVLFEKPAAERERALLRWGIAICAAFVLLRLVDVYGDANHWQSQAGGSWRTVLDFLNTSKYPPSLLFLLMTLGPAAIFCAYAERWRGWLKDTLVMYGRVPFAFYIVHWFLVHTLCLVLGAVQGVPVTALMDVPGGYPPEYGLPLPGVYLMWLFVVVSLYPWVRWMAAVKTRSRAWWLSYV